MKDNLPTVVYSPESALRHPYHLIRDMIKDLLASRELAWRLYIRNTSAQYRQSLFGYLWAFLPPIITTLTFVFLSSQQILNVGKTNIPYPAYVMLGTLLWQLFADAMNSSLRQVVTSKSMLAKINFPREALILAGLYEVLFNFAIRLVLLVIVFVWFRLPLHATLLLVPLGVAALTLLGLAIGILLCPLGALYDDVGRGLVILTSLWFFVTPVVYPPPTSWPFSLVTALNPVSPLLTTTRDWLTTGAAVQGSAFPLVVAGTFALLFVAWMLYRLAMPYLIERMSA